MRRRIVRASVMAPAGIVLAALLTVNDAAAQQEPKGNPDARIEAPALPIPKAAAGPFRDCDQCPELIELPGGTFSMGSDSDASERPVHAVTVAPFALGRFPVTVSEWRRCVVAKACSYEPIREGGGDDTPVHNVSWDDAAQYVAWLSQSTERTYRLPTEAEWEYAARAKTTTRYWWGDRIVPGVANCKGCGEPYDAKKPLSVTSLRPNPFGLQHMGGGVAQWVSDCWHKTYRDAPKDGASWDTPGCRERVLRGGSWMNEPSYVRSANRDHYQAGVRYPTHGFRVARQP